MAIPLHKATYSHPFPTTIHTVPTLLRRPPVNLLGDYYIMRLLLFSLAVFPSDRSPPIRDRYLSRTQLSQQGSKSITYLPTLFTIALLSYFFQAMIAKMGKVLPLKRKKSG